MGRLYLGGKRLMDIAGGLVGACILALVIPFMSIWIKLDSPGPTFYRAPRLGRYGRPFYMLKFRTMVADAERLGPPATPNDDPRITRVGLKIRRTKLDELPQLLNVLRGQMSLVGPRPEEASYFEHYDPATRAEILSVRPGMTDLASLEFRDEGSYMEGADDPVQAYLDKVLPLKLPLQLKGVRSRSISSDIAIILRTVAAVVRRPSSP